MMVKEDGALRYFDLTTLHVKPGKRQVVLKLLKEKLAPLYRKYFSYEVGYFTRHYGPTDDVMALWGFDSEQQRMDQIALLETDEEYQCAAEELYELLLGRESQLLQPTAYSPLR